MRSLTILLIFNLLSSFSFSQNYFKKVFGTDSSTVIFGKSIETDDNKIILAGFKYTDCDSTGKEYFLKLSETGEILNEKYTYKEDSMLFNSDIIKLENNHFLACTYIWKDTTFTEIHQLIFSEYDYSFNKVNEFRTNFPTDSLCIKAYMTDVRKIDDEFICFGTCASKDNCYYYIYKMSNKGDSLNFKIYPGYFDIQDIEITDDKKYIFVTSGYFYGIYDTISRLNYNDLSTDSIFDTEVITGMPGLVFNKTYIEFITDTTFIFYAFDYDDQMNVTVLDTSFNVLNNVSFGFDYTEYPAKREGISILNNDEIFIANQGFFGSIYGLTKIDSELNIIWEKFYNLDDFLPLYSIEATEDGGCIIVGTKDNSGRKNAIIIKTDNNGNISGINDELTEIITHELILYPNPGNEQLNIRTAIQRTGGVFTMYDITGKLVFQQKITESITEINTQNLQSGTYIYNYTHKGKKIENGKWVKD